MTKLSVNVNKVATLRNTRHSGIPSVTRAATLCLQAGAEGITVHPRPDERHIRTSDVHDLAALLKEWPEAEFNIEGNPFEGRFMDLVAEVRPHQCTLVPDDVTAFTSNQGWNVTLHADRLREIIEKIHAIGSRVSLFLDPILEQVEKAAEVKADRIELYTEPYAEAFHAGHAENGVKPFSAAAQRALELGLGVNAGHDLSRENLPFFLRHVPGVLEVSIGHALIADALEMGYDATVKAFLEAIRQAN